MKIRKIKINWKTILLKWSSAIIPNAWRANPDSLNIKIVFRWLLIGLLIRLLFMPFTMHSDMTFIHFFPSLLAYQGVLDPYTYIDTHFFQSVKELGWYYYPPLSYYTLGFFQFVFRPFVQGFDQWLLLSYTGGMNVPYLPEYLFLPAGKNAFGYIFSMKLPYLFFDMLAGIILLRIPKEPQKAIAAFKFWMLNPIVIYSCFIFGQFDIISTFFFVLSIYFAKREKNILSVIMLGIGGGYKLIPMLLLPIASVYLGKSQIERIKLFLFGISTFLIPFILLGLLSNWAVLKSIFPQVLSGKIVTEYSTSKFIFYAIFIIAYLSILIHALYFCKNRHSASNNLLPHYYIIILLLFFISMDSPSFHYFVILTPLLALAISKSKTMFLCIIALILSLMVLSIKTKLLWAGLLAPLHPTFFLSLPSFEVMVGRFGPYGTIFNWAKFFYMITSGIIIANSIHYLLTDKRILLKNTNSK